jgi:SAM-dependent methyltransferase
MSSSNHDGPGSKFTAQGVREYERRRYRGIDQRIVHAREVRLIKKFIAIVRKTGNGKALGPFLDMPCGYGRFTELLRSGGAALVDGDLSQEMVRRAGAKSGIPGVVANAKQGLPFKNGVFGIVFSIRFFHHLHDPEDRDAVLREFSRVSSGWVVISFYRMNGFHRLQRKIRRMLNKSRTNIRMIERGRFEREAKAAGLTPVSVKPLFRGLHAYHLALLKK